MTPQSDEDEVWRQIVASFNQPAAGEPPWPERENVAADSSRRTAKPSDAPDSDRLVEPGPPGRVDEAEDGDEAGFDTEDDEGHYIPPPPPPLPSLDVTAKIAWIALFGGPAYLLLSVMLGWELGGWPLFGAIAAFIGGFITLVLHMGDEPPKDSGWDNGAVV
ncbi:hypothetical protein [Rhizohabitans arisaemae]|uniref:hypothetical protein n=1 Tax=Rhizohabitans arisaemae TaxID=2720610 RepID=UPI0024B1F9C9|nr:hypothetical protein [Rhizohabitans arisaemae]